jgi:hypothetical protein
MRQRRETQGLLPIQDLLPSDMTLIEWKPKPSGFHGQQKLFLTELLTNGGYLNDGYC